MMKKSTKKSPCVLGVAVMLSWLMAIPSDSWADPQAAGQRAQRQNDSCCG
jgi:hypothetical protein